MHSKLCDKMRVIALGVFVAHSLSIVDAKRERANSKTTVPTASTSPTTSTSSTTFSTKCKCSYSGFSSGIDVSNEGRGCFYSPMLENETYHCYVSDAEANGCQGVSPSTRYPGAFLRACNPLLETLTPYNDVLPFDSVTEAFSSRKDLSLFSLIVSTNTDFGDVVSNLNWNQDSDAVGTLFVPTNAAIENFARFRLMEPNLTSAINSENMSDALKTLIVDGSFGRYEYDGKTFTTFTSTMQTRTHVRNLDALTLSYADAKFLQPYIDSRNWLTRTFDKIFRRRHNSKIMSKVHSVPSKLPTNLVVERSRVITSGTVAKPLNSIKVAVQDLLFARNGVVFVIDGVIEPASNITDKDYEILSIDEQN